MKPVVWTIAGTDPGGGAGIQGDLKTMNALGVHGCSVITAMIAQNTMGVSRCDYVAPDMIQAQLDALADDLPPQAIKMGMIGGADAARVIAAALRAQTCPVIYDPVMISTSGRRLMEEGALQVIREQIFPRVQLLTPNLPEAEQLLGRSINGEDQMKRAARDLLGLGVESVLLKGGHSSGDMRSDYWTDGQQNFWLSSPAQQVSHTHGTGCTLSSAIAACRALGLSLADSLVIGKTYINQGLRLGGGIGKGKGPLAHEGWPAHPADLPWLVREPASDLEPLSFQPGGALGLYPLVEKADRIPPLLELGVTVIQLRVKERRGAELEAEIRAAVEMGRRQGAAVYINDYWQEALRLGAYGVHLGQRDLAAADLAAISKAGMRLGASASSWADLARLRRLRPSCTGLGAVFSTASKDIAHPPLGVEGFRRLRATVDGPVAAIGGITLENAGPLKDAGADGIAVIADLAQAPHLPDRVRAWQAFFERRIK